MLRLPWRIYFLLLLLLGVFVAGYQDEEEKEGDPGLFYFVSRPDLTPPRWNITTYHEDQLAPGYWFLGPYRILNQHETFGKPWVGAHIYDQKGELVWSGAKMFSQGNIEDFRVSNVNGEDLMTLMDQGRGEAVIFDNHFEVRQVVKMDHFNSHELHFVENGTRALVIKGHQADATDEMSEKIGWYGPRRCHVAFDRLMELDVTNWQPVFEWNSYDHIGLDESTLTAGRLAERCGKGLWDYVHTNSIDKTPDGDYLYSGRHSDTIYKISKDDKSIIWRLGGVMSDFPISEALKFSRQHDVRFRGQNDTHMLISILDNAKGIDAVAATHAFSRGLLLAIHEKDMTVSIEKEIEHPLTEDRISPRRGNYQVLPNDNIFMGWSEQGCQSEHSSDGTLLQEAIFAVKWLGTYRQYKFPFVGMPSYPPDVHSETVHTTDAAGGTTHTVVHVSWNGDTEVHKWELYHTNEAGEDGVLVDSVERTGFETRLEHNRYARYIILRGIDKNGEVLRTSNVFETTLTNKTTDSYIQDGMQAISHHVSDHPLLSFLIGFFFSAGALLGVWFARRKGVFRLFRTARYQRVQHGKETSSYRDFSEYDEQSLPLTQSRKESLDDGS